MRKSLFLVDKISRRLFSTQIFQQEYISQSGPEIALAGRKYLAGSQDGEHPRTLEYATDGDYEVFRMISQDKSLEEVSKDISEVVNSNLDRKGAILFKGLSSTISTNPQFSQMAEHLGEKFSYTAGFATREEFGDAPGVMAAADDPPEVTIEPHLEMSYNKDMPGKIMFYCHQAPQSWEGGQTPICDMRKVYQELRTYSSLQPLLDEGLRYYRTLPSRHTSQGALYSWEKTFFTEDKASVEATLSGLGYDMEWTKDGSLRYSYLMSAIRPHPRSGEMVWANQSSVSHGTYYLNLPIIIYQDAEFAPSHTAHKSGTPFDSQELSLIRKAQWEQSRAIVWEKGDLLVLDNHAVGHGRMGFHPQTNRNLVVAITK